MLSHIFSLQRGTQWLEDESNPERLFELTFYNDSRDGESVTFHDFSGLHEITHQSLKYGDPELWDVYERMGEIMRSVCDA